MENKEVRNMSPLVLAYMGDAIYEVYVRDYLIKKYGMCKVKDLHKRAISFVKAKSQALAVLYLEENLSEEEMYIVRRGRNQKSNTVPKNADIKDYRYATGFEALIGYLHLSNQKEKMEIIIDKTIKFIEGME
ncbi:Mini-ribonuclease 3 [Tepidibacter formicigenes]|jgi:ribonuclease-3 family protein|uniref:Mini-ribonuclease 3 n=1 Tax=Tepidibacter formicigenes DSM 15518 TaxID=1123349 RepID=A0A1M6T1U0_9FIRM|nr:ribonuclease III domain-containing protein [Tepidibacter formicigenes]SHK50934.1 ribonuclease-3 family protein [Tepidibacter formicigenes DSM 15518]